MRIRSLLTVCTLGVAGLALMSAASVRVQDWSAISDIRDLPFAAGLFCLFLGLCAAAFLIEARVVGPVLFMTEALDALSFSARNHRWANVRIGELSARYGLRDDEIGALARALGRFQQHVVDVEQLNRRFNAVLDHLPQGVCFYNNDDALVVSNPQYAQLYKIDPQAVRPGMRLRDVIELRRRCGDDVVDETLQVKDAQDAIGNRMVRTRSGRMISIHVKEVPGAGWLSTHLDITRRIQAEEKIAHLATHDPLTGLANRTLFQTEMSRAMGDLAQGGQFAIICLDLDRFKQVNDGLGHALGDELLKQVSNRIRATLRDGAILARLGGDEFAIIFDAFADRAALAFLARRIVDRVSQPYALDKHRAVIGVSIGIAIAPQDGDDAVSLLKAADMALYHAKAQGRGTYRFYEPEMDADAQERRSLAGELRKALDGGQLQIWYQPIINLATGDVAGCEALLRWNHPTRGLILPSQFITIAEESGQIEEIGAWVLHEACAAAAEWTAPLSVSVNLSPWQFRNKGLLQTIESALRASGLDASRLELEVTEAIMQDNAEANLDMLSRVRALGARVSLDDFGTGHASLNDLRRFAFDRIKLHRSFIQDLGTDGSAAAIVRAVLSLGAGLSMQTIAEGVETLEQLDLLRAEGCTQAQGYLIAAPAPPNRVEAVIAELAPALAEKPALFEAEPEARFGLTG